MLFKSAASQSSVFVLTVTLLIWIKCYCVCVFSGYPGEVRLWSSPSTSRATPSSDSLITWLWCTKERWCMQEQQTRHLSTSLTLVCVFTIKSEQTWSALMKYCRLLNVQIPSFHNLYGCVFLQATKLSPSTILPISSWTSQMEKQNQH